MVVGGHPTCKCSNGTTTISLAVSKNIHGMGVWAVVVVLVVGSVGVRLETDQP